MSDHVVKALITDVGDGKPNAVMLQVIITGFDDREKAMRFGQVAEITLRDMLRRPDSSALVRAIIALLPQSRSEALSILEKATRMVERFARSR